MINGDTFFTGRRIFLKLVKLVNLLYIFIASVNQVLFSKHNDLINLPGLRIKI